MYGRQFSFLSHEYKSSIFVAFSLNESESYKLRTCFYQEKKKFFCKVVLGTYCLS